MIKINKTHIYHFTHISLQNIINKIKIINKQNNKQINKTHSNTCLNKTHSILNKIKLIQY